MKNQIATAGKSLIPRLLFRFIFTVAAMFGALRVWAQDVPEKVDVDIDTGQTAWYGQPWVWAVGIALFIIIIVAISRGGSRREV